MKTKITESIFFFFFVDFCRNSTFITNFWIYANGNKNYFCFLGKKLRDGKGIGGKGRLTLTRIHTIQSFYGKTIRDYKGDSSGMSRATHAILKHYSSLLENPNHEDCPPKNPSKICHHQLLLLRYNHFFIVWVAKNF